MAGNLVTGRAAAAANAEQLADAAATNATTFRVRGGAANLESVPMQRQDYHQHMSEGATGGSRVFWWAAVATIITLFIALFDILFLRPSDQDPPPTVAVDTPAPAPTVQTRTADSPSTPSSPTDTVIGSPNAAPEELGEIVSTENCGNFGWGSRGPARIAGTDYPDSLPVSCFGTGDVASVDFLVPSGAKLLTGVAGIDDNTVDSNARVTFSVLDTAHKPLVPSKTLAYGQAWKLSVPLDGEGRIRLQTEYKSSPNDLVTARWANMQFTF